MTLENWKAAHLRKVKFRLQTFVWLYAVKTKASEAKSKKKSEARALKAVYRCFVAILTILAMPFVSSNIAFCCSLKSRGCVKNRGLLHKHQLTSHTLVS